MDYQITCICGHSFLVSDSKLRGSNPSVNCPQCGQSLNPVIKPATVSASSPPPALSAGPTDTTASSNPENVPAEETKRCPYCGEVILAIARKCKHCGEFLDRNPNPPGAPAATDPLSAAAAAAAPTTPPADVPPVYSLAVSQWDNFWKFIILLFLVALVAGVLYIIPSLRQYLPVGVMGALVIAGFFGWFFYLAAKHTRCYIRPTRIDTEEGILSKELNSLELFRITDMELKQSMIERLLGIGTIKLMTAESGGGAQTDGHGEPELVLYQIPKAREVYKYIQNQVPIAAKLRGAIYMEK